MSVVGALRRRATAVACIAVGVLLVGMAVPRLAAGLAALPANAILGRVQDRSPVSPDELRFLIRSRERALAWHETGRMWTDLALARLLLAERQAIVRADRDLDAARGDLLRGLALAPANPFGWLRLAAIEQAVDGPSETVMRLVQMSILTGPAERPLLFPRLEVALASWPHAGERARDLVRQQLRWAWRADRRRTVALVRAADEIEALWSALADSPDDQQAVWFLLEAMS